MFFTVKQLKTLLSFASTDEARPNLHAVGMSGDQLATTDGHTACVLSSGPRAQADYVGWKREQFDQVCKLGRPTELVEIGDGTILIGSVQLALEPAEAKFPPVDAYWPTDEDEPAVARWGVFGRYLARIGAMPSAVGCNGLVLRQPTDELAPVVAVASGATATMTALVMPMRI